MNHPRSSRGETLAETLVAILIVALSAAILAAMTGSSVRILQRANAATQALYQQITAAETGSAQERKEAFIRGGRGREDSVFVYVSGEENGLRAYWTEEVGGG